MNWLKRLFSRGAENIEGKKADIASRGDLKQVSPAIEAASMNADQIHKQNVEQWITRLEREGNRTGNARLMNQARNLRLAHPQ